MFNFTKYPVPVKVKIERWPPCDDTAFWGYIAPESFIGLEMMDYPISLYPVFGIDSIDNDALVGNIDLSLEAVLESVDGFVFGELNLAITPDSMNSDAEMGDLYFVRIDPISLEDINSDSIISNIGIELQVLLSSIDDSSITSSVDIGIELDEVINQSIISDPSFINIDRLSIGDVNEDTSFISTDSVELKPEGIRQLDLSEIDSEFIINVSDINLEIFETAHGYENDWRWWFLEITGPYI